MVDVMGLNLVCEVVMMDSDPAALDRLKVALNGGYGVYQGNNKLMIFEETV